MERKRIKSCVLFCAQMASDKNDLKTNEIARARVCVILRICRNESEKWTKWRKNSRKPKYFEGNENPKTNDRIEKKKDAANANDIVWWKSVNLESTRKSIVNKTLVTYRLCHIYLPFVDFLNSFLIVSQPIWRHTDTHWAQIIWNQKQMELVICSQKNRVKRIQFEWARKWIIQ